MGGSGPGGGEGRCERRSEVFVKIKKKKLDWVVGSEGGMGVRVDVNAEVEFL